MVIRPTSLLGNDALILAVMQANGLSKLHSSDEIDRWPVVRSVCQVDIDSLRLVVDVDDQS